MNKNKVTNLKKWIHSKTKKPGKKKQGGPIIDMTSKLEEWENNFLGNMHLGHLGKIKAL